MRQAGGGVIDTAQRPLAMLMHQALSSEKKIVAIRRLLKSIRRPAVRSSCWPLTSFQDRFTNSNIKSVP